MCVVTSTGSYAPSGSPRGLSARIVPRAGRARGKILAVTPHAHWGTVMGAEWREGLANVWSLGASLISGAV